MSEATSVRIEDLEVSVRSMALLLDLGVETLGDLLALPSIAAPKLVVAELTELLAEHGLRYQGTWEVPQTPSVREATGSITERWQTIEGWMEENATAALASLRPPASAKAIAEAEQRLGVALPEAYKELVARHDGQEDMGPMVAYCSSFRWRSSPRSANGSRVSWTTGSPSGSPLDTSRAPTWCSISLAT